MRVYGSSPLYKYLELIFRSRRLFLISFLIATATTTLLFFWQPNKYVAKGYFVVSGKTASPLDPSYRESESERELIKKRISQLNVLLQQPFFFRDALSAEGMNLEKNGNQMSVGDFEKLYTEARKATTFTAGDNYLEIDCTWPNRDVAQHIVVAVWKLYTSGVALEEGKAASDQNAALSKLEKDYGARRNDIDIAVKKYQEKPEHVRMSEIDPAAAANQYYTQTQEVERGKNELKSAQQVLAYLQAKLKETPKTRNDQVMRGMPGQDAIVSNAQDEVDKATKEFADVQQHATPANPRYKEAADRLKKAQDKLASLNPPGSSKTPSTIVRTLEVSNPEYDKLSTQVTEQSLIIKKLETSLASAEKVKEESKNRATTAPQDQYEFKRLTKDLALYTQIHEGLKARLQQSIIDAKTADATARGSMHAVYSTPTDVYGVVVDKEASTKRYVLLAAGPLLGLVVGFAFSLLSESLDHSVRTPAEVEKFLGKPVLAILPSMKSGRGANRQIGGDTQPTLPSA